LTEAINSQTQAVQKLKEQSAAQMIELKAQGADRVSAESRACDSLKDLDKRQTEEWGVNRRVAKQVLKIEENNTRLASSLSYHNVRMDVLKIERDVAETKLLETLATVSKLRRDVRNHRCQSLSEASPVQSIQDKSVAQEQIRLLASRLNDMEFEMEVMSTGKSLYEKEILQLRVGMSLIDRRLWKRVVRKSKSCRKSCR
jgi:hypothetical protein